MATKKTFFCTDVSKLYDLGFIHNKHYNPDLLLYQTKDKHRIWIYLKKDNLISFVHHNFDTYEMLMKMIKLDIVEIRLIETYSKETEIEKLKQRIAKLEEKYIEVQNND